MSGTVRATPRAEGLASGAGYGVDIQAVPTWILWIFAATTLGLFVAVLFRMMPAALRRRGPGRAVGLGAAVFVAATAVSRDSRGALWFGAIGFLVASFPLLWMGKLPADMPPASDPAVYRHPQYKEIARRGRIAGLAIVVLAVTEVALSVALVRGL